MYSVLNTHSVDNHAEFYLRYLQFNATFTCNAVFQKQLYNGIPNVTVWRVLRKRLHLKAYKLFIVKHLNTVTFEKLSLKHPV
jgi:hypothetical protein